MPRLDGIDIAHYQWEKGPVDLGAVRAVPTFWFAQKASQSTSYVDPTFATARAQAAPAGFSHVGLYHWLSSTKNPVAQAVHLLNTIGPLRPGEFVMLDAEEGGITVDMCVAWCERVESATKRPSVVYSGLYVAGGTIWKSADLRASRYGPRPFIVAAYVSEANLKARLAATHSPDPHAWQYSSNGPVPGIVGRCDMDMIHDRAAFDLASGIVAAPLPPPFPPPQGDLDTVDIRLLTLTNSDAQFLAETTADGRALNCRWADGSAKMQAVVAAHRGAAAGKQAKFEQSGDIAGLANVALLGPLPHGDSKHTWSGDEFSAFDRPAAGVVDQNARDAIAAVSADLSDVDASVDKIKAALVAAGN